MNKKFKLVGWLGIVAVLSAWMWSAGKGESFNPVTGLDIQLTTLLAFLLLTSTLVLGYLMFQDRRWSLATTGVVGIAFLSILGWTQLNFLAVLAFFIFNFWSANRVRREIRERRILNIPDALYHGLTAVVLGLFVMVSFAAYQSPWADQIKASNQLPGQTRSLFQELVDKTVGQKVSASTPQQREQIINEIASQTFQEFNAFLKPYFQYAPPVLAFGLFLILWGLSFVFIWLGVLVGLVLYWILKKTRVVRIEKRQTEAEVLVV